MPSAESHKGDSVRSKILEVLHASDGEWVSGEELSRKLEMSRAAVSKHMRLIREAGYPVESMTRRGYRLSGDADSLRPEAVRHGLATDVLGQGQIVHLQTTPSTNMEARVLAERGAPEGTVVLADEQTAGRGRQGRPWLSPSGGGVYMSVVLRPACEPQAVPVLTLMAVVAVTQAVRSLAGVPAVAKWPNDVLAYGRKMSGVLIEAGLVADTLDYAVAGIGINVNTVTSELPEEVASISLSLKQAAAVAAKSGICDGAGAQGLAGHTTCQCVATKQPCADYEPLNRTVDAVLQAGAAASGASSDTRCDTAFRDIPRAQVARRILEELEAVYTLFRTDGGAAVIDRWKELSGIVGRRVRLGRGEKVLSGLVKDVDENGWLLLEDDSGNVHRLPAGDILEG